MTQFPRSKKIGASVRVLVSFLLLLNLCGCALPQKGENPSSFYGDHLEVASEEIPFIDKRARAIPHSVPRGRYSDKFPDTVLTDHLGRKHHFYSDLVKDRIVVIQFFYTTCSGI